MNTSRPISKRFTVEMILAHDVYGVIGVDHKLPWHLPEDLKNFKRLTTGHVVIMGRLTYQSLGSKPLPNRINIVISSAFIDPVIGDSTQTIWCTSLANALDVAETRPGATKAFIIGGSKLFAEGMKLADVVHRTFVINPAETTGKTDVSFFGGTGPLNNSGVWLRGRRETPMCVFETFYRRATLLRDALDTFKLPFTFIDGELVDADFKFVSHYPRLSGVLSVLFSNALTSESSKNQWPMSEKPLSKNGS